MLKQFATKCINVDGVNINCYYAGKGKETIMLLHGAGVDSALLSWAEVIPLLSSNYRVIAPDLPGYGASDRIDGEYTLRFYTDMVKGVIHGFDASPVILNGLSLGGGIGLNLALTYPELVKILILVDAWGLFAKLPWHRLTYWYTRSRLNVKMYSWAGKYRSLIRWLLEYSLIGDKTKVTDDLINETQKALLIPGAGTPFISFQKSEITSTGLKTDLFSRLGEITIPTLLIHGSKDKAVPVRHAIEACKNIPDCDLYLMEGCKHWPQKERPEEFAKAILKYLEQNSAKRVRD